MPLNPKCYSISASDANDAQAAATALDATIVTAVDTIKAIPGVLANQIQIVPLGTIWDSTNYVASATVLYSTTS